MQLYTSAHDVLAESRYNSRLAQLVERVTSICRINDEVSRSSRLMGNPQCRDRCILLLDLHEETLLTVLP